MQAPLFVLTTACFVSLVAACSVDDPTVSPKDFVSAHAQDAHSVVVSVQEVEAGIGIMGNDPSSSDASAMVSFDGILSNAQSSLENVSNTLLSAAKPKGVDSSETEMWSATDELSTAVKSLRAYVDDQKPSDMTDFHHHWDQGRAWWNQAVTPIWQAAGASAPTIENAPAAPPVNA